MTTDTDERFATLAGLAGAWEGESRLWFEPGALAGQSASTARLRLAAAGTAVVFEYDWSFDGIEHAGVALLTATDDGWQMSWTDSFHHADSLMALVSSADEGAPQPSGEVVVDVTGTYAAGEGPPWGWRTTFSVPEPGRLDVTTWNIDPDGNQGLAVLATYERV
jgi:hypothetical protein